MNGPGALILAFGAGLLSFLSPCTLPLLPGYLAYISGLGVEEVQRRENAATVLGASVLFVLGFSLVFVATGATASYIGSLMQPYRVVLTRVAGVFVIAMALFMIGWVQFPLLYQDRRFHLGRDLGIWSALPLGMAFAFGWSPCIGPVLTSIFAFAMQERTVQEGAFLLFVYALGLGVPFLVMALFADRAFRSLAWFKRYFRVFNLASSGILLVMGIFLVLNRWTEVMSPMLRWYSDLNLPL
jgi:cytochrome c-type biogenesis protein